MKGKFLTGQAFSHFLLTRLAIFAQEKYTLLIVHNQECLSLRQKLACAKKQHMGG